MLNENDVVILKKTISLVEKCAVEIESLLIGGVYFNVEKMKDNKFFINIKKIGGIKVTAEELIEFLGDCSEVIAYSIIFSDGMEYNKERRRCNKAIFDLNEEDTSGLTERDKIIYSDVRKYGATKKIREKFNLSTSSVAFYLDKVNRIIIKNRIKNGKYIFKNLDFRKFNLKVSVAKESGLYKIEETKNRLESTGLSQRAVNILYRCKGVEDVDDFLKADLSDLRNCRNCGEKTYMEIIDKYLELVETT